ncbi:MAG: hypothetical protein ACE5JZ_04510 [Kiloniellales bacterium]
MNKPETNPAVRLGFYRLIQGIFVADIVIGALMHLFADRIGGADEALVEALEIVGFGLVVAGAIGYFVFAALARGARKAP